MEISQQVPVFKCEGASAADLEVEAHQANVYAFKNSYEQRVWCISN